MIVSGLLTALNHLMRAEKLRALQQLATELVEDEVAFSPETAYPLWSPHTSHEAADALLLALAPPL